MDIERTVCFIGHRRIPDDNEFSIRVERVIKGLPNQGYCYFIFGDHSQFNTLCYNIVSGLIKDYPNIERIHYRTNSPELDEYSERLYSDGYEKSVFPKRVINSGKAAYIQRNRAMIYDSKVCVFYYDNNCSYSLSGTKAAYEFASNQKKEIIKIEIIIKA